MLSSRYVITAAHCLQREVGRRKKVKKLHMTLGDQDWSQNQEARSIRVGVEEYWIHPQFTYNNMNYDIALVRLSADISFVTCMDHAGTTATVSGWGRSASQVVGGQQVLRSVEVRVMSNRVCQQMYTKGGREVTDSMVCAMAPGADACSGDSGGPLTVGGVLVGVVSWGVGCAEQEWPGVYARVESVLGWIQKTRRSLNKEHCNRSGI